MGYCAVCDCPGANAPDPEEHPIPGQYKPAHHDNDSDSDECLPALLKHAAQADSNLTRISEKKDKTI